MKHITIKRLVLVNFKGIAAADIQFGAAATDISGRNATGKTTLMDAFTWALFGKDSQDRKQFDIKTLDRDGHVVERLPHEVSAVLDIDGEETTITRRFTERWVRRRGQAEETFDGHEEERLWDGIPCTVREWQEKINALCDERTFKMITSPTFFLSQKTEDKRRMLFDMAGTSTDADIAGDDADFRRLLADTDGITLEEYARKTAADKLRIKREADGIPARIDERKRDAPQDRDWGELDRAIKAGQEDTRRLERQLDSIASREAERGKQYREQAEAYRKLEREAEAARAMAERKAWSDYNAAAASLRKKQTDADGLRYDAQARQATATRKAEALAEAKQRRETLIGEWKAINARQFAMPEGADTCPTCGQPLPAEDLAAKRVELEAAFNARKAEGMKANTAKGRKTKAEIERLEAETAEAAKEAEEKAAEASRIQAGIDASRLPAQPDTDKALAADKDYQNALQALQSAAPPAEQETPETDAHEREQLREKIRANGTAIDTLKKTLADRDIIAKNNARIDELRDQLRQLSDELARIEGIEFTIARFRRAKTEDAENRINALFPTVRFRMSQKQINGGETEACEATVGGVPYASLNRAARINAGLEIAAAISRHAGISAPVWIDNAESVNDLTPMDAQTIRLIVSNDQKLTIINH